MEHLNKDRKVKLGDSEWIEKHMIRSEEFEKDNDANFHIDFMYAMGNCRAAAYKLEPMDWITVKLKAGRIVPALATTTASISGLQTLELVKIIKESTIEEHRNIFLNLAVPIMTAGEPGVAPKIKLLEGLEVNLWDRWEIKDAKDISLQEFMAKIEETYKGLEVKDVIHGNAPLFMHAFMSAPGKEQDKKKALASKLTELVDCESDDKFVDLTINCQTKENGKEVQGVPSVRVYF